MPRKQTSGEDIKSRIESFRSNNLVDVIKASGETHLRDGYGLACKVLLDNGQSLGYYAILGVTSLSYQTFYRRTE